MYRSKIAGIGMYVPQHVVTNNDLLKYMDTTDSWIQERTGIKERRYAHRTGETTTTWVWRKFGSMALCIGYTCAKLRCLY